MNNRKYATKSVPKAWKKKKSSLSKRMKLKQQQQSKNSGLQKSKIKNLASLKSKKPKYLNKPSATWKLPTFVVLSCLITIILVIPTMIVIPFGGDNQAAEESNVEEEMPEQEAETVFAASPFSVEVMRDTSDSIEDVPLEEYVSRVVASEMPGEFEVEALKAQALAARTYIVNHILFQDGSENNFDVTDTTAHQVYKSEHELRRDLGSDYDWKMDKINKAVAATEGEILTYEDAPITPAYFSTSNGYTENSEDYWDNELPYLRSVESPWDENSPEYLHQEVFSMSEVEDTLEVSLNGADTVPIEVTRTESQRVNELAIAGSTFSGREIREQFELQSSDFTIEQKNDHFIFTTKGFGHGIGMSQYGANGMAKEGETYQDIVKHYYQDVEISTVNDTAPTLVAR
ncbi:stage II sporulation protein D [Virgibacillus sp. NKC19-16]|uniref:stage II sporulation protein D n=1 Tax=Virgibacillus salidurans TaxID=2831673 RepID=UPI001F181861|nr:stage II sporulation protein D [Virgibacillus sp. NKC19-16]UJL45966.1 stage II sporulation protein D [Virgibacillus sp. NKC19-16]